MAFDFVNYRVTINYTQFKLAIEKKCFAFLQLALDHKYNINNIRGDYNATPLFYIFKNKEITR